MMMDDDGDDDDPAGDDEEGCMGGAKGMKRVRGMRVMMLRS